MDGQIGVDWDVGFWADQYPLYYLAIYNRELGQPPEERLKALWRWKALNRTSYGPEDVFPYLEYAVELCDNIEGKVTDVPVDEIVEAFVDIRNQLRSPDGPLSSNSRVVVTPQFLLHLADNWHTYSGRFPILDTMVARAHRVHTAVDESKTLQDALVCSDESYGRLIGYFFENCETAVQVARLERALFVQGRAIGRYREDKGEYDKMRKVPVKAAREYLDEIVRHTRDNAVGDPIK